MGLEAFAATIGILVVIVAIGMMGINPFAVIEGIITFIGGFFQAFGPLLWIILQVIGNFFSGLVSAFG